MPDDDNRNCGSERDGWATPLGSTWVVGRVPKQRSCECDMLREVTTDDPYELWEQDAALLAEIGRHLFSQTTQVRVRLPRSLAAAAVAKWERDGDEGPLPPETALQTAVRHKAGTVGLIGLCIENRGVDDGDEIVVDMPSWYVGLALEAADEAGLLNPGQV